MKFQKTLKSAKRYHTELNTLDVLKEEKGAGCANIKKYPKVDNFE